MRPGVDHRLEPLHRFRAIGEADRLLPEEPAEALRVPRLEEEAVELDAVEVAHVRRGERGRMRHVEAVERLREQPLVDEQLDHVHRGHARREPPALVVGDVGHRLRPEIGARDQDAGLDARATEPLEERLRVVRLREVERPAAHPPRASREVSGAGCEHRLEPGAAEAPDDAERRDPVAEHDGGNTPGNAFEVSCGVGHRKRGSGPMFRGARLGRRRILGTRRLGQSNARSRCACRFSPQWGVCSRVAATDGNPCGQRAPTGPSPQPPQKPP